MDSEIEGANSCSSDGGSEIFSIVAFVGNVLWLLAGWLGPNLISSACRATWVSLRITIRSLVAEIGMKTFACGPWDSSFWLWLTRYHSSWRRRVIILPRRDDTSRSSWGNLSLTYKTSKCWYSEKLRKSFCFRRSREAGCLSGSLYKHAMVNLTEWWTRAREEKGSEPIVGGAIVRASSKVETLASAAFWEPKAPRPWPSAKDWVSELECDEISQGESSSTCSSPPVSRLPELSEFSSPSLTDPVCFSAECGPSSRIWMAGVRH
jgi:hypothetical protein